MDITLTPSEMILASHVGFLRQVKSVREDRPDRYGCPPDEGWQRAIEGACAEAAVAKALNRWWSGTIGLLREADVGKVVQVRSTFREDGALILHEDDKDDSPYVLTVGLAPDYRLVGWLLGREGKLPQYWRTDVRHPAYFVPQSVLHPFEVDVLREFGE